MSRRGKYLISGLVVSAFLVGGYALSAPAQPQSSTANLQDTQVQAAPVGSNNSQSTIDALTTSSPKRTQTDAPEGLSNNNYYTNVDGNTVHAPAYEESPNVVPSGASAQCGDGTYSFSQHRRGTCSHHGGVSTWY